jgi:hypothetical protein
MTRGRVALRIVSAAALFLLGARQVARAAPADVCLTMSGGQGAVAGLQVDLAWDGSCMSADTSGGICKADPATGKTVMPQSPIRGRAQSTLRALMLSIVDTNPIPDGNLFCCTFKLANPSGGCCGLTMGNVAFSDSTGHAPAASVSLSASVNGLDCGAAGAAQPPAARAPLPEPASNAPGEAPPAVSAPGPQPPAAAAPAAGRAGPAAAPIAPVPPGAPAVPAPEAPVQAGEESATAQTTPPTAGTAAAVGTPTRQRTPTAGTTATAHTKTPTGTSHKTPTPAGSATVQSGTPAPKTPGAGTPTPKL